MRRINVKCNNEKGPFNRYASLCAGAGRAGEALRHGFQEHLETVVKECGFKYLRFHGIFHEDMGVYREDEKGNPIYNFQYVDLVYDSMLDKGIKPFVELAFMPKLLADGTQTVFWWETNVNPPKDPSKWYQLVKAFVSHLEERYGREEVTSWYFEVWNEPNHPAFFTGTMEDYFSLYDTTVQAVKDVCPAYRVGGPATCAGNEWVREFIDHCVAAHSPVDFISTHIYGVSGAFDEFGDMVLYLIEDKDFVMKYLKGIYEKVKASPLPELEIHITEWSSSYSSRDPVHDSYHQATYILYHLKNLEGLVDSLSYWTFTDVFEEVGPPPTPFHGGFGLINLQSLKKPAFFAYKLINDLGEIELVNDDVDSWACKDESGVQVLFWDYTKPCQKESNSIYFTKDQPPADKKQIAVAFEHLKPGSYCLEIYTTGYMKHDTYTEYLKMGAPKTLNREETAVLARNNSLEPHSRERVEIDETGVFTRDFVIDDNDICFIKLTESMR